MLLRFLYNAYNALLAFALVLYLPLFLLQLLRHRRRAEALLQRFGRVPPRGPSSGTRIWIHAVSVGELQAIQPLARQLREENFSLVFSTTTAAGNQLARQQWPEAEAIIFFPFDFSACVRRSLSAIRPDLFIMVETEIWPNFIWNCAQRDIPTVMVNGRISDRSFTRYHLIRRLLVQSLGQVRRFCMQTPEDARRLIRLGADPDRVRITGNLKYDVEPRRPEKLNRLIAEMLAAGPRVPLLVAGSTAEGEEAMLLDTLRRIRERPIPLKMVLAPRSPKRFQEVADLLARERFSFIRRSYFSDFDLNHPLSSEVHYDIFLLDSIGELTGVYEMATVVFVGKSLVPGGGQNILEPAYFGKPILFGPSMENFREVAQNFLRHQAALQVTDPEDLTEKLLQLLHNRDLCESMGKRASRIISENRGAAGNTLNEIRDLVRQKRAVTPAAPGAAGESHG
ncbi:MAG: 3-deoxy-D-manno-octulosonic acid transferase [Acidobacteria bacterium]|nr:3-deoxy-D-manno-octulosonic acid transferase [Acidobacteriota bacterium]